MTGDMRELTALYALGALDADETAAFERWLATSPEGQREVTELQAVTAQLGSAVAEAPPAALREKIARRVASTPQDTRLRAVAARSARTRWRPTAIAIVAAAAVIVVAVLSVTVVRLADTVSRVERDRDVYAAADAVTVTLDGAAAASARVVWSPSLGEARWIASGLDRVGPDEAYELWAIVAGEPVPVGLFTPDADGEATERYELDLVDIGAFGVTVEPAGGSPQPTSPILLLGEV